MNIRKIAGSIGVEITEVQVSELASSEVDAVRDARLEHGVIFFRDQDLGAEQFLRFACPMGEPVPYPVAQPGFARSKRGTEATACLSPCCG